MKKLVIALVLAASALSAQAEVVEAVIARVGDRIITRSQYLKRLNEGYEEISRTAPPAGVSQQKAAFRDELLNEMLSELLLKDRADRIGITVTPEELREATERLKRQYNITTEEAFVESLQKSGLTKAEMEIRLRDTLITNKLFSRELRDRTSLTDKELRERYEREKESYRRPERAHIREIVILGEGIMASIAEEKAKDAAQRARSGQDFAALAKEVSEAPTKENGGDLGVIAKGELRSELDTAVFAAPAGTVLGPIQTPAGFHVIKVEERIPSEIPGFDSVKEQLRQDASEETFQRDYKAYVEKLRKDAFLEIYEENVPKGV